MNALLRRIDEQDRYLLIARLTLLLVIVNTNEDPLVFVFSAVVSAVLFLQPGLLRLPWPWFALAAVVGASQALTWWKVDDHAVVTTYWLLALGLSRLAVDRDRVLSLSARWLVGLVFAFAFGWKLLSSQYISTDFFRYQLLADERFHPVTELAGGADDEVLATDRERLADLYATGDAGDSVEWIEGERTRALAAVFTAWGAAIEGLVAAAFLLPLRGRWRLLRPATLFAFAYTTYAVVPIAGFGALLMVLGLAERDTPRLRRAMVVSFGLLLAWGGIFPAFI